MAKDMFGRIQKLLALAGNNSNAEEAQSAMAKARALMVEHGLSEGDFEGVDGNKIEKNIRHVTVVEMTKDLEWWKRTLGVIIAESFRCFSYTWDHGKDVGKTISLCGLESDVEIASQVYQFAVDSIEYTSKAFRKEWLSQWASWAEERKRANYAMNDFIKGYLNGMHEVFKEQEEKNNWGLVLVKDALVTDEYAKMNLRKSKGRGRKSSGDPRAFEAGREQGRKFNADNAGNKRIGSH